MGNKIIAVNWKWTDEIASYKEYSVSDCNDCKVYFTNFKKTDGGTGLSEYKQFIKNIFQQYDNQVLVLSHRNPETNNISKVDLADIECRKNNRIDDFIGTETCIIYYGDDGEGGFLSTQGNFTGYENFLEALNPDAPEEKRKKIPKSRFNKVWDYYWNQLELEYQNKTLFNTFQQLLFDVKGISEASDHSEKEKYENEMIASIKSQKKAFEAYKNNFQNLQQLINKAVEDKLIVLNEFEIILNALAEGELKDAKYFDKNNKKYFPNLLKELTNLIDLFSK